MELGAALALDGDLLRVVPRNDIYVRYLNDNRGSIAALASEHYGRPIRVEVALATRAGGRSHRQRRPRRNAWKRRGRAASAAARASRGAAKSISKARWRMRRQRRNRLRLTETPIDRETARKELFADPIVRRILDELQGRLVDVRRPPATATNRR